ncbi:MAG: AI-2E family transporter [Butyrivibrio sp.]|nr:AI-2E family transporter [Muribaculum sp.]MCM1553228.1 AI-2E family transporter [Butyrivibrio sp.]
MTKVSKVGTQRRKGNAMKNMGRDNKSNENVSDSRFEKNKDMGDKFMKDNAIKDKAAEDKFYNDKFSERKIKQICGLMVFAAVLVLGLVYSGRIYQGAVWILGIVKPFLYGGVIAFVLNLPMKWIEEKLLGKWKGKYADKAKRPVSMVGAMLFLALILAVVMGTVIPQLSQAVAKLGQEIPLFINDSIKLLERYSTEYPQLKEQVAQLEQIEINWDGVIAVVSGFLQNGVGSMLTSTVNVAGSIISGVVNGLIAFIFALYILSQKEKLANQGRRVLSAYLPYAAGAKVLKVLALLNTNFSNFITGQCVEAVILGVMFVVTMTVFRMPYAFMVGVLIAFTALIPVVGAFIGCVVGAFLILLESPVMAVWFVVMFLILQQIEGNLIYPRVVGSSVGLPSIWVLMAVSLGASFFGVAGILFFIPLLATLYALLREDVNSRNAAKRCGGSVAAAKAGEKKKD